MQVRPATVNYERGQRPDERRFGPEDRPRPLVGNTVGVAERHDLDAGDFSRWLDETRAAHRDRSPVDVACGDCTACCTSAQFIHIEPDEAETLIRIPVELLFDAPGLPRGHLLMGYDENGHCPMLNSGKCSIYHHRPQTCRTYDCRVFAATGVELSASDKSEIAAQAGRWKFRYSTAADRAEQAAVSAASKFLIEHQQAFPTGVVPSDPTQLAVLAVAVHRAFLGKDKRPDEATLPSPTVAEVELAISAARAGSI